MEQLCEKEGCLSEPTSIDQLINEVQEVTTNKRIDQRFESTKDSKVGECKKGYSLTQLEVAFESDNYQQTNVFEGSKTSCNDLRNVINAKKFLNKSQCMGDEYATEILDFKRENVSLTKPIEHDNTSKESVKSSPKKYTRLCVTVTESLERKVVEQSFDLDFTIDNRFHKLTTTKNKDSNNNKPEVESEEFTNNLKDIIEKQYSCEPLSEQQTPTLEDKLSVDTEEFELAESDNLLPLTNRVTDNKSNRTGLEDLGSESDSNTEEVLKSQHPNRRLQVDRPVSDLDSANQECKTTTNKHLHLVQRQQSYKRKRRAPSVNCEVKKLVGIDQKCPLTSRVKRRKLYSLFKKARKMNKRTLSLKKSKSEDFLSEVLSTPDLWSKKTKNKLSDCVESLHKVCENRRWPQPRYKHIPGSDRTAGFRYKSVQFTRTVPASNHELAAETCLDLGFANPRTYLDLSHQSSL